MNTETHLKRRPTVSCTRAGVIAILVLANLLFAWSSMPANAGDAISENILTSHAWSWGWTTWQGDGGARVSFQGNGTVVYRSPTAREEVWRWELVGPRNVHINQTNGRTFDLVFDQPWSKYTGTGSGNRSKEGVRLDPAGRPAEVAGSRPELGPPPNLQFVRAPQSQRTAPVAPVAPPPAAPAPAVTPSPAKSEQVMIEILSDQAPNVANWITAPLDRDVPGEIWQNMTFLKEALRDEAVKNPMASRAAYALAVQLCYTMVADLEERRATETLSGGDAVLHQKSNLTEWRRDHLTWPMYALEADERAERHEKAKNTKVFMKDLKVQEWANRSRAMRVVIDAQYGQFREALRQSPPRKSP
jgi:hypothetical protein